MKYWREFVLIYGSCTLLGLCTGSLVVFGVVTGVVGIIHGLISLMVKATEPRR